MNGAGQPGLFEDEGAHDDGHPAPAPHTMSRAEDPGTSKEAAVDLVLSGRVKGAMAKALEVLQRHPGSTAAELDYAAKTPQGAVRKRLNDLRTRGQAFTKGQRRCHVTGRQAQVWYPVEEGQADGGD